MLGIVKLEFVEDQVYLSDQRIRVEESSLDNVRDLAKSFDERGLGGFTFTRPVNTQSLTELLVAFNDVANEGENAAAAMRDRLNDLRDLAVGEPAQEDRVGQQGQDHLGGDESEGSPGRPGHRPASEDGAVASAA